jgi:thiosulfate/3-mercaptopyruvate sulfurtransferase
MTSSSEAVSDVRSAVTGAAPAGRRDREAVPPVVSVDWLEANRSRVIICDVRWYLDGRSGRAAYDVGHLPGAVFVDLDRWLAAPPTPAAGRHPLPDPAVFSAGMRAVGIHDDSVVVAYDDDGGATAARLVWLLRVCGRTAALLDGGIDSWQLPLSRVRPVITPGSFGLADWPLDAVVDAEDVAGAIREHAVVIDARAAERYAGTVEPVDARAGHIPGAVNLPYAGNLDPTSGRFLDPDALAARYREEGVGEHGHAIVYCGSGVTACHALLAIERAGLPPARLYAGSWSQWSADDRRPVATGHDP